MPGEKTCPHVLKLEALANQRLDRQESSQLSEHLENCPDCRRKLAEITTIKESLKLAATLTPQPAPASDLQERISRAWRAESRRAFWRFAPAAVAATLAAVFMAMVLSRPHSPSKQPPVPGKDFSLPRPAVVINTEGPCGVLQPGSIIVHGQEIFTEEGGRLLLRFGPGEYLFLGCSSRLSWQLRGRELAFKLVAGRALFRFQGPAKRTISVETGAALVRTLGTVFSVEMLPAQEIQVEMYQGAVEIKPQRQNASVLSSPDCARVKIDLVQPVSCTRGLLEEMTAMLEGPPPSSTPPAREPASHKPAPIPRAQQKPADKNLQEQINSISRLLAARQFEKAEPLLEKLLAKHPREFSLRLLACDALRLQEKFQEALAACRLAEDLARQDRQKELALYQQGRLLLQLEQAAEAEKIFSGLLVDFPAGLLGPESLYALLEAQLKQGKMSEARRTARLYLEKYPQGAGAREMQKLLDNHEEEP